MMEVRLQVGKVIPPHPGRLLERKKLINLLKQGEKKGIVYISAPAGYGKTTLLTSYVSKHKGNLGWLTIDEGDRNLYLFLHYLVGSIQRVIPGFGVEISRMITDGKSQNQDMIFNTVINELITIEKPMLLVLDDLHHIQDHPEISLFLHSLIINRLPHISLFIASRIDPSGRLSYALTKQAALFITERQLRFRRDEMQKLAHAIGYKRLPNSKVNLLNRQSRGWAIAVVNGLNAIASGKRRPFDRLDDYFEAVFSDIDKQARWYFLMASLLPHINQKLLDLIFPGEGKMVLKTLLSRGLFLTRLSDQENYLLHPLFKSYLAERLKNADYRRYLRTKRCAGRHFLRSGHFALAMDLLLEGEAFNLVLTQITKNSEKLMTYQGYQLVKHWLERIPEDDRKKPKGQLLSAWVSFFDGDIPSAADLAARALKTFRALGDIENMTKALSVLLSTDLYLGKAQRVVVRCHKYLNQYQKLKPALKALILQKLASGYSQLHQKGKSITLLKDCLRLVRRSRHLKIRILTDLAVFAGQYGDLHFADRTLGKILEEPISLYEKMMIGTPRIWIYLFLGRFNQARESLKELDRINSIIKNETSILWKDIVQAFYYIYTGDFQKALSFIQIQDLITRCKDDPLPFSQVIEAKVRALLCLGSNHEARMFVETASKRFDRRQVQTAGRILHLKAIVNNSPSLCQQAISHYRRYPYHYRLAEVIFDFARFQLRKGKLKKAKKLVREGIEICNRFRYDFLLAKFFDDRPDLLDLCLREGIVANIPRVPRMDRIEVLLMGPVEVRFRNRKLSSSEWGWRKNLLLFLYLCLAKDGCLRKEDLLSIFWPGLSGKKANQLLHNGLHRIRQIFDQEVINYQSGHYSLDPDLFLYIDANDYLRRMERGLVDIKEGRSAIGWARISSAQRLIRGKMLVDIYEKWAEDCVDAFETRKHEILSRITDELILKGEQQKVRAIMKTELRNDPSCPQCLKIAQQIEDS